MTAEVAILNKSAVALAADSAVTVERMSGGRKTYNTNKLFTLSKYHPVGVMVYGDSELMGVPWETIVKSYRRQVGERHFDAVEDYANDLIAYLGAADELFDKETEQLFFYVTVSGYFYLMREEIDDAVKQRTDGGNKISEHEIADIANATVDAHFDKLQSVVVLPYLPEGFSSQLTEAFSSQIAEARKDAFGNLPLSTRSVGRLETLAGDLFAKDFFPPRGLSGLVVAGFGQKESFPVVKTISTHRIVLNHLIYRTEENLGADVAKVGAALIPFAQSDVVHAFLAGVDPSYSELIDGYLATMFQELPGVVAECIEEEESAKRDRIAERLNRAGAEALEEFRKQLNKYLQSKHIKPLLEVIGVLPKDELAAMAEALVNLTSVKRKMSLEVETVGGPIDVAVISKGDGFVWIKRKHYFSPELNHHFIANYFRI